MFLLSKLLKSVLEMLKDMEGAGLEPGTLEHAHISIFLKNNIGMMILNSWATTVSTGTLSQSSQTKSVLKVQSNDGSATKFCWTLKKWVKGTFVHGSRKYDEAEFILQRCTTIEVHFDQIWLECSEQWS